MSLTILRWRGGMCGDTVLKLVLLSNPHLRCQNQYVDSTDLVSSRPDIKYVSLFEHDQIGKMSLKDFSKVNLELLKTQLDLLEQSSAISGEQWILKSHVYDEPSKYRIIDIIANANTMPFVVNANLIKNSSAFDKIYAYHPIISKIKDPEILDKFHMFNMAKDLLSFKNVSHEQLHLEDILGGWDRLSNSLSELGFNVDQNYQPIYQPWLDANKIFMPSQHYQQLVTEQNFDYLCQSLNMYERYCLLALSRNKFKILT